MKTMTIEDAVRWAVRDELPKVGVDVAGGWIKAGAPKEMSSPALAAQVAGQMGASVDARTNCYGVVPDFGALGRLEPHPAALAIGDALLALDIIEADGFGDWEAFGDLASLGDDPLVGPLLQQAARDAQMRAGMVVRMIGSLSALMVKRAVLGPPTGWEVGEVKAQVLTSHGKPLWFRKERRPVAWNEDDEAVAWDDVEVDGYNSKAKRPYPEAYRKHHLAPDPMLAVMARAEWQLWRASLDVVIEDISLARLGVWADLVILPSALPMTPWVDGPARVPRVLSGGEALPPLAKAQRPVAGRLLLSMAKDKHAARYRA